MKKVVALANGFTGVITEGKEYEVLGEKPNGSILVKNNKNKKAYYPKVIFADVVKEDVSDIVEIIDEEVVVEEEVVVTKKNKKK